MSERVDKVVEQLSARGLDALLVTSLPNLRWLSGFTGTNGACLVGSRLALFFTDFRYREQAAAQVLGFERLEAGRDLLAAVAERLDGRVGFEDATLSVRSHAKLAEAGAGRAELVPASGLVERLRERKDERELEAMRRAAAIADRVYEELAERGIAGRSERRIAFDLETRMRELGADDRSFPAIVASGAHGALPHAEPRELPVEGDTLMIVDMGCMVDGYCSDCTRTFATGELSDEAAAVYELVARAQREALAAARPGAAADAVDAVAREIIDAGGFGEAFGHGLGHGVGLEVHEGPRLGQTSDAELAEGVTVTIEPGVYLPDRFGVRIEDLVAVRDGEPEILTRFSKELVRLA